MSEYQHYFVGKLPEDLVLCFELAKLGRQHWFDYGAKEVTAMKVYKGIVKGNTVILEEKPDLPDECPALVEIKPLDQARDEEISRRQIALLKNPHKGGKLLYRRREELYDRR